jgi:hypothetical protein
MNDNPPTVRGREEPRDRTAPSMKKVAGRVKGPWPYDDFSITFANNVLLTRFSKIRMIMIELDNASTVLDFSAITTNQDWHGEVNITAFLQNADGVSLAEYRFPKIGAFCGTNNVFTQTNIDSAYFELTAAPAFNYEGFNWIRCK